MNPFKTKEFLELQGKWSDKLKDSGFNDIEQTDGNLKVWSTKLINSRDFDLTKFQAKERYYQLAGQFLNDYPFENKIDKTIWMLHSEGVSIRNIYKELKKRRFKTCRDIIHAKLKRLTNEMICKYKLEK